MVNFIKPPSMQVYAFILGRTVALDVTSRADVRLVNGKNRYFHLEYIGGHTVSEYKLTINDASALGFTSPERTIILKRFRDIVLAMNLALEEAVLNIRQPHIPKLEFSTNEKVKETVHVIVKREKPQLMDESTIILNLDSIDKFDWHIEDQQGAQIKHNLGKALRLYEDGFNQTEGKEVFRYIFNGVEDAINFDWGRSCEQFDKELSVVANIPEGKAAQWRSIYNRIKHPDHIKQRADQLADYLQAIKEIPDELIHMRQAANRVMLKRLEAVKP